MSHQVQQRVDRDATCPFLLRIFYKQGSSHPLAEFENGKTPKENEELQVYTWMDVTLREISEAVQNKVEYSRKRDTQFEYSLIFSDFQGRQVRKHLGSIKVGQKSPDDVKSLQSLRFMIGDYLCIAIQEPSAQQTTGGSTRQQQEGNTKSMGYEREKPIREYGKRRIDKYSPRQDLRQKGREIDTREERNKEKGYKARKSRSRSVQKKEKSPKIERERSREKPAKKRRDSSSSSQESKARERSSTSRK